MERGRIKRPLLPYIPPSDPIQDAVEVKLITKKFKATLHDGTIVYHAVYDNGLNEAFITSARAKASSKHTKNPSYIYWTVLLDPMWLRIS